MIQWIHRRRGWLIPAVFAAALAIGLVSGNAIAAPAAPVDHCAQSYLPGSSDYKACRFLDGSSLENINSIPGHPAGAENGYLIPQPVKFCLSGKNSGKRAGKKPSTATATSLAAGCQREITCRWNTSTGKYHCTDAAGRPANPPGRICAENANYACGPTTPPAPDDPTVIVPTGKPVPTAQADPSPDPQVQQPTTPDASAGPISIDPPTPAPTASTSPAPTPSPSASAVSDPADPTAQAIRHAQGLGLRIWLETDLVAAWQAGPDQLKATAARLAQQANQPNVLGVKFAAELGLRGTFTSPEEVHRFVSEASAALRATMPPGRRLAVDVVIPELGCGRTTQCLTTMGTRYPLLTRANVQQYVLTGAVDAINVASPLFQPFLDIYKQAGISPERVLQQQWMALRILGWNREVPGLDIGARDLGLAHPDNKPALAGADAETAVKARVDGPLRLGAEHVVLWTWKQTWNNVAWRLNDAGLRTNGIWEALAKRKDLDFTGIVFNPRETEDSIARDLEEIAKVASTVYLITQ
ncbi:hypothetical protein GCM10010156_48700 [Planobispora rosea]|uniref:Uncharacterized protein n=1 Tax=Planobispora rosea TaxID=35762 RepID=A0A8J3S0M8_PLARO|nr:hypothetical protein [Planobispora rosea]GGS84353.1 hypothetical protein GCM10010156_48700 [Planobispora rosea]GIH86381.1 hypothetical protein Pro02_47890 [Planobispora rosea]